MSDYTELEKAAASLFFVGKKTNLDYDGYCDVVNRTGNLYLQLLRDLMDMTGNQMIAADVITIGNLMIRVQQRL
jgi:hypothetical protein